MRERSVARHLNPFDRPLRIVEGEEANVTLADWRERLQSDPESTVAELVRRFGPRRSVAPAVEDLFWRVLVDYGDTDDLARAVVGRVRAPERAECTDSGGLLDLDREHRVRVRGRLRVAAREALRGVVRDEESLARIARHPSRLPEAAFALRGRPAAAAALYALEHDHLAYEDQPAANDARFVAEADDRGAGDHRGDAGDPCGGDHGYRGLCRAALRYEVARSLQRIDGGPDLAVLVMQSVVRLIDEALETPGSDAAADCLQLAWRLSFHAREWLGFRYFDGARYGEAEHEFLRAAGAAPETDLAVAARMFAANAMIRDGRADEARRLLDSLRIDTQRMAPPIADEWIELRERLIGEAGEQAEAAQKGSNGGHGGA